MSAHLFPAAPSPRRPSNYTFFLHASDPVRAEAISDATTVQTHRTRPRRSSKPRTRAPVPSWKPPSRRRLPRGARSPLRPLGGGSQRVAGRTDAARASAIARRARAAAHLVTLGVVDAIAVAGFGAGAPALPRLRVRCRHRRLGTVRRGRSQCRVVGRSATGDEQDRCYCEHCDPLPHAPMIAVHRGVQANGALPRPMVFECEAFRHRDVALSGTLTG